MYEYTARVKVQNGQVILTLPEGAPDEVEVTVKDSTSPATSDADRLRAYLDQIKAKYPDGRFRTGEEVDRYIQIMRAEWE